LIKKRDRGWWGELYIPVFVSYEHCIARLDANKWWQGAPDGVRRRSHRVCRVPLAFQVATSYLTPSTRTATPAMKKTRKLLQLL